MNSHRILSDTLLNQVIAEAHKTFVSGYLFNALNIKERIKEEMKLMILQIHPAECSEEEFEDIFEVLYEARFNEKYSRIDESKGELQLSLPLLRVLMNEETVENRLTQKFHQEVTPIIMEELKRDLIRQRSDFVAKCTPQTIFAHFSKKHRAAIRQQVIDEEKETLSYDDLVELGNLKEKEEKRKQAFLEKQAASKKQKEAAQDRDEEDPSDSECFLDADVLEKVLITRFNKQFKATLKKEIQSELHHKKINSNLLPVRNDPRYLIFQDPCFPEYDANWIKGTNFIAAKGPREETLASFIHHLFFTDEMKNHPCQITKIVGLGNCAGLSSYFRMDFVDYALSEDVKKVAYMLDRSYQITVTKQYQSADYKIMEEGQSSSVRSQEPYGFVQSHLTIEDDDGNKNDVDAYIIGMPDNHSVFLEEKSDDAEKMLEMIWQISKEPNAVVIHCAAGMGRTGHFLLLLHIIKEFETVFSDADPALINQRIDDIIDRLRKSRIPLVAIVQQKECAIRVAHEVIQYAFRKGYLYAFRVNEQVILCEPMKTVQQKEYCNHLSIEGLSYQFQRKTIRQFVLWAKQWGVDLENELEHAMSKCKDDQQTITLRIDYLQHKTLQYVSKKQLTAPLDMEKKESYQNKSVEEYQTTLHDLSSDMPKNCLFLDKNEKKKGETKVQIFHVPLEQMVYLRFQTFPEAINYLGIFQSLIMARGQKPFFSEITTDFYPNDIHNLHAYVICMTEAEYSIISQGNLLPALNDHLEHEVDTRFNTLDSMLHLVSQRYPGLDFYKTNRLGLQYGTKVEKPEEVASEAKSDLPPAKGLN